MDEIEQIKERYAKRQAGQRVTSARSSLFSKFIMTEREAVYVRVLKTEFEDLSTLKILEIGAGGGSNLSFFKSIGIKPQNIYANELLEERVKEIKLKHPDVNVLPGNALDIEEREFDLVFQSTVFTSILSDEFKLELANKMLDLLKSDGLILWYDFKYNNPRNKDVKGIKLDEIGKLFPDGKLIFHKKVTLAPPIGRRIGKLYNVVNQWFPFLRTHLIVVIRRGR